MSRLAFFAGLNPQFPSPPPGNAAADREMTEEAAVTAPSGTPLRVDMLVEEGALVAQGAPVARLQHAETVCLTAPMAGRVAHIRLQPGRRLSEIVLFREADGDRLTHRTDSDTRTLMQSAGLWPLLRRRPFGGMPDAGETPVAIVVMAADTRPLAPDPCSALEGREEVFARGLSALISLTNGPVFVVAAPGPALFDKNMEEGRIQAVHCGPRHPQGLAGIRIHDLCPAGLDAPVWDIHAEDVAGLGELLQTGLVPETRLVHVSGPALRESRMVRTQPGADLRGLTQRLVAPGTHMILSGSPLDGERAHWLAPRDRQVSVMPGRKTAPKAHWLRAILSEPALPNPVIPTAALTQAFGAALPAPPLVRALTSGDDETAVSLGALSLLEEDLALADYVLGGGAHLRYLLRAVLDRTKTEFAS